MPWLSFLYPPSQDEIYLTLRTRSPKSSPHLHVLWWKSQVFTGAYSRSLLACDARTLRWPQRQVIGWGDQVASWVPHSASVRDVALSPVWCIKHLCSILLVKHREGFITKQFENQVVSHFTAEAQRVFIHTGFFSSQSRLFFTSSWFYGL